MRLVRWLVLVPLALAALAIPAVIWNRAPALGELRQLTLQSRWPEARAGLEKYLRHHPDSDEARILLSQACEQLGDLQAALDSLEPIADGSPHLPEATYRRGELNLSLGRATAAESSWQQLANRPPASTSKHVAATWTRWALGRLGDLYVLENRTEEARSILWQLLDSYGPDTPQRVDFLYRLTQFDVQAFDPKRAIDQLELYRQADPEDIEVARALVLYYLRLGQIDASRALLDGMMANHPGDARLQQTRLEFLVTVGDRAGLRDYLKQAAVAASTAPELWKYRGIDHENHGELEQAIECYKQAVQLTPRDYQVPARLAQALRLAGATEEYQARLEAVRRNGQLLADLSSYASKLPKELGNSVTWQQCTDFAAFCRGLGWERESAAWQELADLRRPKGSRKNKLTNLTYKWSNCRTR